MVIQDGVAYAETDGRRLKTPPSDLERMRANYQRKKDDPDLLATERAKQVERRARSAERQRAYMKAYREKNRDRLLQNDREYYRRKGARAAILKQYGLTQEQYTAMLEQQGGVCAICKTDQPGGGFKHFSVDHDHQSGEVRGLLCNSCNRALGWFGDDPERLLSAADYLRKFFGGESGSLHSGTRSTEYWALGG